jgi:glycerol-3-phosphate dehydrogenase
MPTNASTAPPPIGSPGATAPTLRERNLREIRRMAAAGEALDVLVVGGGINGAVSAACLAARGARVALVDRGDFAGLTSQESSNLAWGGIKYLENFEFGLVRKLCVSRNHLLRAYPSTVQEIRFLTMHERGFRHGRFKLFLGTLLYWLLGSFFTKPPRLLSQQGLGEAEPSLRTDASDGGFEYSDAFLHDNDARFVWGFVRSALDHDCLAANYVECAALSHESGLWTAELTDLDAAGSSASEARRIRVRARAVVNACGPYVDALHERSGQASAHRHVLSKGIHLIVPRVAQVRRVLTFFADDGRMFFAIPMGRRTCIGTTDTRVDSAEVRVTPEDRRFVLDNVNRRLRLATPLTEADVIAERCGVRPLVVKAAGAKGGKAKDWFDLSRKHVLEVDEAKRHVSIYGGKLTDCINVGEEVAATLQRLGLGLPHPTRVWYGEPPAAVRDDFFHRAALFGLDRLTSTDAQEPLSTRLWRRYGAAALPILEAIRHDASKAEVLIEGAEYLRAEIEHTARHEMVVRLDDFLRRRSKIALVVPEAEVLAAPGLREACAIFFGAEASTRFAEYESGRQARRLPSSTQGSAASADRAAPVSAEQGGKTSAQSAA